MDPPPEKNRTHYEYSPPSPPLPSLILLPMTTHKRLIIEFKVEVAGVERLNTDVSVLSAGGKALSVGMESYRVDWTEVTLKKEEYYMRHS